MNSNTSRPVPSADTGSAVLNWVADTSVKLLQFERRFDPLFRPAFDAVLRGPLEGYEREGDVPNVVFPCGLVHDEASDQIRLYYGAADTSICLATAQLGDLLAAVLAAP